jgi:hypothetical protein
MSKIVNYLIIMNGDKEAWTGSGWSKNYDEAKEWASMSWIADAIVKVRAQTGVRCFVSGINREL